MIGSKLEYEEANQRLAAEIQASRFLCGYGRVCWGSLSDGERRSGASSTTLVRSNGVESAELGQTNSPYALQPRNGTG